MHNSVSSIEQFHTIIHDVDQTCFILAVSHQYASPSECV